MAGDSIAVAAETGVRWDEDGRGGENQGDNKQHAVFRIQDSGFRDHREQSTACRGQREKRRVVENGRNMGERGGLCKRVEEDDRCGREVGGRSGVETGGQSVEGLIDREEMLTRNQRVARTTHNALHRAGRV